VLCDLEEGDKECLACLLELVKRRDTEIRKGAIGLLNRYGSAAREAVPALLEVLRNDADDVRLAAINALGAIGPDAKAAIPALKAHEKEYQKKVAEWEELVKSRRAAGFTPYQRLLSAVQAALKKIEQ
jgi:HEAT repeat protein